MAYFYRQGGSWEQGTLKSRAGGQFVNNTGSSDGSSVTPTGGGFGWDQTFTDTSWLHEADANDNLNVERVTTTDFGASGGLEDAVDNADGDPTVVVFEVGGAIEVPGHNWRIREDNIWFAGETAPWPGITITQCRTRAHGENLIFSHMSFLQGDELDEYDSTFDIDHRSADVMLDHCTCAWATEENIGITRDSSPTSPDQPAAERPSIIHTIIGEGLHDNPLHDDHRARGMFSATEYTEKHVQLGNLYTHNVRRQPMMRCESVMCNNYVYNYGHRVDDDSSGNIINLAGSSYEDQQHTWKGLVYEPGPDTPDFYDRPLISYGGEVYLEDIIYDDDQRDLSDGDQTFLDEPPLVPPGLDLDEDVVPASETKEFVLGNVGPRPADRPPYEEDLINDRVGDGKGSVIDTQSDVGGYPDDDTTTHSLDVPSTNIVEWVFGYKEAVELGT